MAALTRRHVFRLLGTPLFLSGGFLPMAGAQDLVAVRLLVLRRLGLSPSGHCNAPCIRGSVYDVSDLGAKALDESLIPLLASRMPLCDVIERPWKDNAANVSAIPRGVYGATVRDQPTKNWMTNENRAWRLELAGTGHRTNIQFHYGQDVAWSEGCFIVGSLLRKDDNSGIVERYCAVTDGERAVATLRAAVTAAGRNVRDIQVGIADHAGLFPNFDANAPCL